MSSKNSRNFRTRGSKGNLEQTKVSFNKLHGYNKNGEKNKYHGRDEDTWDRGYNGSTVGKGLKEEREEDEIIALEMSCLLYTSPSPRDRSSSRMPSSA